MGDQHLIEVDVEQRRVDLVPGLQIDERAVPDPKERLAMLVEDLRQPRVLVLDVPLDEEDIGQKEVGAEHGVLRGLSTHDPRRLEQPTP